MPTNNTRVFNMDCMEGMKEFPDKYFELAIVDPPYGIGRDGSVRTTSKHGGRKAHEFKGWDSSIPDEEYFNQLFRVSINQIIWGANYFCEYLPASMGWVFWDKGQRICNSDGELAFSSFNQALRVVEYNRVELLMDYAGTIHPTQKPIKLYKWLLKNYAKEGDKILDTHLGSQSSRIAAFDMGFDFTGYELDKDYFDAGNKRFEQHKSQLKLFCMMYKYLGDKLTDQKYRGATCSAVRRDNGLCIRGRNGSMLVEFDGVKTVVIGRLLRKML